MIVSLPRNPRGVLLGNLACAAAMMLLAIAPHANHVNLQFADGVDLADPAGLLEGTGKRVRHVKSRTLEDAERPALGELIAQAVARRRTPGKGTAGNPSRRT